MILSGWSPSGTPRAVKSWLLAFGFLLASLVQDTGAVVYEGTSDPKTAYACENGKLILECEHGEVIRIIRANYGRFTISVCNQYGQTEGWNLQCMSLKSKDIISERCTWESPCENLTDDILFATTSCKRGDPSMVLNFTCNGTGAPTDSPHSKSTTTTATIPILAGLPLHGSPRPPNITSVVALSPFDVEIAWTQPESANAILTTVVYFTDKGMGLGPTANYISSGQKFIIKQLRPNTTYEIFMKSFNIHGPSISSNTVNVTTLNLETRADVTKPPSVLATTPSFKVHKTSTFTFTTGYIHAKEEEEQQQQHLHAPNTFTLPLVTSALPSTKMNRIFPVLPSTKKSRIFPGLPSTKRNRILPDLTTTFPTTTTTTSTATKTTSFPETTTTTTTTTTTKAVFIGPVKGLMQGDQPSLPAYQPALSAYIKVSSTNYESGSMNITDCTPGSNEKGIVVTKVDKTPLQLVGASRHDGRNQEDVFKQAHAAGWQQSDTKKLSPIREHPNVIQHGYIPSIVSVDHPAPTPEGDSTMDVHMKFKKSSQNHYDNVQVETGMRPKHYLSGKISFTKSRGTAVNQEFGVQASSPSRNGKIRHKGSRPTMYAVRMPLKDHRTGKPKKTPKLQKPNSLQGNSVDTVSSNSIAGTPSRTLLSESSVKSTLSYPKYSTESYVSIGVKSGLRQADFLKSSDKLKSASQESETETFEVKSAFPGHGPPALAALKTPEPSIQPSTSTPQTSTEGWVMVGLREHWRDKEFLKSYARKQDVELTQNHVVSKQTDQMGIFDDTRDNSAAGYDVHAYDEDDDDDEDDTESSGAANVDRDIGDGDFLTDVNQRHHTKGLMPSPSDKSGLPVIRKQSAIDNEEESQQALAQPSFAASRQRDIVILSSAGGSHHSTVTSLAMDAYEEPEKPTTKKPVESEPLDKEIYPWGIKKPRTQKPPVEPSTTTTTTTTSTATTPNVGPTFTVKPSPTQTGSRPPWQGGSSGEPSVVEPELRQGSVEEENGGGSEGVVDKYCEERIYRGVVWHETRFGRIAEGLCPEELRGFATWRCLAYGWERSGPDLSDCISPWLEDMDIQIQNVMRGEEPADEAAVELYEELKDQKLTSGDLKRTAIKLLPKLAQGMQRDDMSIPKPVRKQKMKKFKKAFMESSSKLLSKSHKESWKSLSRHDRRKAATSLYLAVEDTGFQTAMLMDVGEKDMSVDENIVMEVNVIDTQRTHSDLSFPTRSHLSRTPWEETSDSLTITSTSLKVAGMTGPVNLVFTLYRNMEDLVQPEWNTVPTVATEATSSESDAYYNAGTIRDSNTIENSATSQPLMVVNTKIIAASINSAKERRTLPEPVRFTLHHLEPTNEAVPVCSFWDVDTISLSGQWSQDGCRLLDTNTTHTTCECDHLTNFAVLMDVSGVKLSPENELALRVITFVGCVISIVCLILSWMTFMVFKNLQCDRNTIHKNLVFCLLLAEIVFIAGIAQTETKILCSIIAGLLHYLFLGAFAWMCLEGVQLYVMLVEVFEQEKSRVHWYYLFGYGAPAIVVGVSAAVYHQGYGTPRHCWLTTENYFIWSFVGPALVVMLINVGMLSIAIYTMCRHSNMSATMRERSKVTKFSVSESLSSMETFASPKLRFPELPAWVKGAIVLVVLLGLTWLLGVFYLNEESVIMAYFFTVLNSLQGLFIFVFHCLKNEKVQKEYRKVARRTSWLPNCIRVNYGGYTGVASSSPVGSTGSGNYLSKLFGNKKRKRSASSTNSSAKPFLNKDQYRRSDTENSTSKESSQIPSSLNGYIYNPTCVSVNSNVKTPFLHTNGNGPVIVASDDNDYLTPHYETVDGLAGELSEYIDCSVVDSEFVSEYCKHNMQVSNEERRYSTGSEDSEVVKPMMNRNNLEVDNLSTLSLASSSRRLASNMSSMEVLDGAIIEGSQHRESSDPGLNLQQYIIPTAKKNGTIHNHNNLNNNNNLNVRNNEHKPKNKVRGADNVSSSMNKLSKPVPSLSSIPETENSPTHSSTPNIQFKLGFTEPAPPSPAAHSPESNYSVPDSSSPVYDEVKSDSPSSGKSSLPNLSVDGLTIDVGDDVEQNSLKRRHSSETDIQFSPFRFSQTDC